MDKIKNGVVASIVYRLTIEGELIEEATADEPLEYLQGSDNIVPGLERALEGKSVGDKVNVTLQPDDAYGEYDDEDFEVIAREDLPDDLEVGMEVLIEDDEGAMFEAVVTEITSDSVTLNFNSPLAGKVVTFDAEVVAVRSADAEEIEHGHPHSYHDEEEYEYED